jgi:hypothetical protein
MSEVFIMSSIHIMLFLLFNLNIQYKRLYIKIIKIHIQISSPPTLPFKNCTLEKYTFTGLLG